MSADHPDYVGIILLDGDVTTEVTISWDVYKSRHLVIPAKRDAHYRECYVCDIPDRIFSPTPGNPLIWKPTP